MQSIHDGRGDTVDTTHAVTINPSALTYWIGEILTQLITADTYAQCHNNAQHAMWLNAWAIKLLTYWIPKAHYTGLMHTRGPIKCTIHYIVCKCVYELL